MTKNCFAKMLLCLKVKFYEWDNAIKKTRETIKLKQNHNYKILASHFGIRAALYQVPAGFIYLLSNSLH